MSNAAYQKIQENQQRLNECMDEFRGNQCLLATGAAVVEAWLRLSPDADVVPVGIVPVAVPVAVSVAVSVGIVPVVVPVLDTVYFDSEGQLLEKWKPIYRLYNHDPTYRMWRPSPSYYDHVGYKIKCDSDSEKDYEDDGSVLV